MPQSRKRLFIIGVRNDLKQSEFPKKTHGKATKKEPHLKPYVSHGEAIRILPPWPEGEVLRTTTHPEGHFSIMSRNSVKLYGTARYTVVANWRHAISHPAVPGDEVNMKSNLEDGAASAGTFL